MYEHQTHLRVRYAETDQMGYAYYGQYATYFEVARVEALRHLGLSYKDMEQKKGILMPVRTYHCEFLAPIHYDTKIRIRTRIPSLPTARIRFEYDITEAETSENTPRCQAQTTLFFLDQKTQKPTRAPEALLKALRPFFPS